MLFQGLGSVNGGRGAERLTGGGDAVCAGWDRVEEIGNVGLLLVSDEASYVTGVELVGEDGLMVGEDLPPTN